MRSIISIIILLLMPYMAYSQYTFDFEEGTQEWKSTKGKVYATTDYFKQGKQALAWEAPANAELSVGIAPKTFADEKAIAFYVHSAEASADVLNICFYNGKQPVHKEAILLNFSGWRVVQKTYADMEALKGVRIDRIGFMRASSGKTATLLCFDDIQLNREADKEYLAGPHMALGIKASAPQSVLTELYNNPVDIIQSTPTSAELAGITAIAKQKILTFDPANEKQLERARNTVQALDLKRNKNGRMTGKPIDLMQRLTNDELLAYTTPLAALASSQSDKALCIDYIDYLLEQGIAEGVNYRMRYSDYAVVRKAPLALFAALQVATENQKPELLKLIKWLTEYGKLYYPQNEYPGTMNADILTNYLQYYIAYALAQPTPAAQVAEMKAFSRFLCRQTEYTQGDRGILKADGTGFHHKSHYNNYMYAYRYWIDFADMLKGTEFRVDKGAFDRMSKAVTSMYVMMGRDKGDNRFTANSLAGRNAYYKAGAKVQVYKKEFKKLIEIGGDIQGKPFDNELAAAYNYFFMTDEYAVPAKAYNGFYQFNYSPIGVYRTNDWVVVMRSPTTKFWGAEIYNKTNRMGRYQSNGTVEVIYNGGLTASGLPANEDCGGWDWNVIPGTTTVHYTHWAQLMPSANTAHRFDQFTLTKDFAGALAWGEAGLFAADFDQIDRWGGKQNFEPTHLTYKKSVFACDGLLICLGSDISAGGNYADDMITATNLFQEMKSKKSGTFTVNGETVEEGFELTQEVDQTHYIRTHMSTGYIIPKQQNKLVVKYGKQTTPKQTGEDAEAPKTTQVAAKAYIDHGVKTSGKQYAFVVMPQTTDEELAAQAKRIEEIYRVERMDENVHLLNYLPKGIEAYTFFAPACNLTGVVKGATSQLLLLTKAEQSGKRAFAICNPNHQPKSDEQFGWISQPTEGTFIVEGKWNAGENKQIILEYKEGDTIVHYRLADGAPQYFTLTRE